MNDVSPATTRRRLLSIGAVAVAGGSAGCLGDGEGGQGTDDSSVDGVTADADAVVVVGESGEHRFAPDRVYVDPGGTVRWEWEEGFHTVTPDSIPEESDWEGHPEEAGERFTHSHTFEVTGVFQYYCDPHRDEGMTGEVVVSEEPEGENGSDGGNETENDLDRTDPGTGGGGGDAEGGGDEVDGEEVADEEEPGSGGE